MTAQYVLSRRYIHAPVLRWQDANDDGDVADANETVYVTTDASMNVTALVDTSGNVVERYACDAYGQATVLDADWSADADGASDVRKARGPQAGRRPRAPTGGRKWRRRSNGARRARAAGVNNRRPWVDG